MKKEEYVSEAIKLAFEKHKDQKRRFDGAPYFGHLERVANLVESWFPDNHDWIAAAFLHDVIEDTDVTAEDLREMGFSEDTIYTVVSMSKNRGEPYIDYIKRVMGCFGSVVVKMADLTDNASDLPPKYRDKKDKYELAKFLLKPRWDIIANSLGSKDL